MRIDLYRVLTSTLLLTYLRIGLISFQQSMLNEEKPENEENLQKVKKLKQPQAIQLLQEHMVENETHNV